jgi:hypothetical protein
VLNDVTKNQNIESKINNNNNSKLLNSDINELVVELESKMAKMKEMEKTMKKTPQFLVESRGPQDPPRSPRSPRPHALPAQATCSAQLTFPTQLTYPAQPTYPAQSTYPAQLTYLAQSTHPSQPTYPAPNLPWNPTSGSQDSISALGLLKNGDDSDAGTNPKETKGEFKDQADRNG